MLVKGAPGLHGVHPVGRRSKSRGRTYWDSTLPCRGRISLFQVSVWRSVYSHKNKPCGLHEYVSFNLFFSLFKRWCLLTLHVSNISNFFSYSTLPWKSFPFADRIWIFFCLVVVGFFYFAVVHIYSFYISSCGTTKKIVQRRVVSSATNLVVHIERLMQAMIRKPGGHLEWFSCHPNIHFVKGI